MTLREKVIKGMECCLHMLTDSGESHCEECPYNDLIMNHSCKNPVYCIKDYVRDALKLLKKQRPVKQSVNIDTWVCPDCGRKLEMQEMLGANVLFEDRYNFCPTCGRAVEWNAEGDRQGESN